MAGTNKKVTLNKPMENVTLETSYTATQAVSSASIIDVADKDTLNLFVSYTTGEDEVTASAQVIVFGISSDDYQEKVQIGESAITGGTATYTPTIFNVAGGTGSTTYNAHFRMAINWKYIMVQAKESDVTTNQGTISIVTLTQ